MATYQEIDFKNGRKSSGIILSVFILILVAGLTLISCVKEKIPENHGVETGDPLPSFSVTLSNGREITTESLRGKRVLIELFNTGCNDCRESLPVINELYEALRDNEEIEIFAIARAEEASQLALYWEDNGFTLPYSPQSDRKVYEMFANVGIPRIYVADTDGIITATFGPEDRPSLGELISLLKPENRLL